MKVVGVFARAALFAALVGAGLFAGSQAISEAANPNRAQVIPDYSPGRAVAEAAVEGAALGTGGEMAARGLGALWMRAKTGAWQHRRERSEHRKHEHSARRRRRGRASRRARPID